MNDTRPKAPGRLTEGAVYGAVAVLLVIAGALLRTVVLNWVVGPATVVVGVVALSAALEHGRTHR